MSDAWTVATTARIVGRTGAITGKTVGRTGVCSAGATPALLR